MSKARPVFPGAVLFTTRRVHKRQFLLRPSKKVNQIIEYVLAVLAERHGILLHAICILSNHGHDVSTDPDGKIVEFRRELHALLARHINALFGEFEAFWAREPTCRVECVGAEDILDKIIYTLANPVEALLVERGEQWPGVRSAWPAPPRKIKRPKGFFRGEEDGGSWPEEVTLSFHRPPGFDELSDEELATLLRDTLETRERGIRKEARRKRQTFLGPEAILAQRRHAYPRSKEKRFGIRPTVAAKWKWARIERLRRNKEWLAHYEAALRELRAGNRDVVFPFGTYKLHSYYRIACQPAPPSA